MLTKFLTEVAMGYSYANGRQTGVTYPSGRAITYGFDAQGQVASIAVKRAAPAETRFLERESHLFHRDA